VIDQPRYAEWVRLSHRAARFEKFMTSAIQGLGKLDAVLSAKDTAYLQLPQQERESIERSIELTERFTESYLWVLGAYEIIRTMDQRVRENAGLVNEATCQLIRDAKHKFERVRVPLAKFEAARCHSDTDSSVAFPALNPQHGIAWCVADDVFVTRRELSECFMALLRAV
jgi:hypothetical protein